MIDNESLQSLERLHKLKEDGVITAEDFETAKQNLLQGKGRRKTTEAVAAPPAQNGELSLEDHVQWALLAKQANAELRLTQPGGPLRHWVIPSWPKAAGLSFHRKPERWLADGRLEVVSRGQEFVTDVGDDPAAKEWLERTIQAIRR